MAVILLGVAAKNQKNMYEPGQIPKIIQTIQKKQKEQEEQIKILRRIVFDLLLKRNEGKKT